MKPTDGANTDLEIKVISARHLWAFNFFQKLCVYTAASLTADASLQLSKDQAQEQRTAADSDGDGHPDWNHPMAFRLSGLPSPYDLFLRFELRHHAGLPFPDRTIGEVRVPLSDLFESSSDGFRFVDYQVRSSDGKSNGDLRFAYKLNRIGAHTPQVSISGYPQIEKQDSLYPAAHLWEDTPAPMPTDEAPPAVHHLCEDTPASIPTDEARPAVHQNCFPQPPLQYPIGPPPIWPPPPPPPYWAPPGFRHPPPPHPTPPHPPPGHFHYPWSYQPQTESQHNNGR